MPKHVKAVAAQDPQEERQVRKRAKSCQAPADGKVPAQMVLLALDWQQERPGHLSSQADGTMLARDEEGSAQWTLNALAQAAKATGIAVKRSQIRHTQSRGSSADPDFLPKGPWSSATAASRPRGRRRVTHR